MVYHFTLADYPDYEVFMGYDKFENEKLIQFGWPEDVWFHVDTLSSAHVYVRMPITAPDPVSDLSTLPEGLVDELAQLTKANSIEGCKKDSVDVVYTKWENLRKTLEMEVGAVSFKNRKEVVKVKNIKTDKMIIKRLEKTKTDSGNLDFERERKERDRRVLAKEKEHTRALRKKAAEDEARRLEQQALRSYDSLNALVEKSDTNLLRGDGTIESCRQLEEDFM
eukprot:GHVN01087153.1.p1 GENE.GHVN01087153.1~~GHVN01087153.1.p1  ORF type:complete len:223 (-),score=49.22 GHVN01087153.1:647-1315(-)